MATHYEISKTQADLLVTQLLSEVDKTTPSTTDLPVEKLLNAAITKSNETLESLATFITEKVQLRDDTDIRPITESINEVRNMTKSIQFVCQVKSAKEDGLDLVGAELALVNTIYDEVPPDEAKEFISDHAIKALSTFSGDQGSGSQVDILLEQFLESAYKVAVTNMLSYKGCVRTITRKLTGTALLLYKAWLDQNSLKESDITLPMLVHFLEKRFALHSTPKQAMIALASLPPITDHGYLKAVGHISRLCRLSVRKEKEEARKLLFETRANESFRNSLSNHDRAKVLEKDRERLEQGMSSMNYNKMAEYLTQCHTESPTGRDQKGNMLSSFRINEAEEEYDDMAYQVWQPRGRGFSRGGRGRPRGPPPRGASRGGQAHQGQAHQGPAHQGQPHQGRYQAAPPTNRGGGRTRAPYHYPENYQNNPPQGGYRGNRGAPPPRGRSSRSRGGPRGPDRYGQVQQDSQKVYDRPYIRNEDVNVQTRGCLLCNQLGHSFLSDKCPYFGRTKLWSTPCPSCGIGGHSRRSCLINPMPTGQNRGFQQNRGLGQRRTRNVQEDNDGRFHDYSGSDDEPDGLIADLPQGEVLQHF